MEIDDREYIHLEKDASEEKLLIEVKNVNGEDVLYLLSEFIYFVSKKENIPPNIFLMMIGQALIKKEELENKRGNKE